MRILLADDHDLVRETLIAFFEREADFDLVEARDFASAMEAAAQEEPLDLLLLDYDMPGMNGLNGLRQALETCAPVPVALISGAADAKIAQDALGLGAIGFLPKTIASKSLINAVRLMAAGEKFAPIDFLSQTAVPDNPLAQKLTKRETEVLGFLCQGLSNKEIARETDLQEVTIKLHVKTLCRKLDAKNRTQAAMIAKDAGLV